MFHVVVVFLVVFQVVVVFEFVGHVVCHVVEPKYVVHEVNVFCDVVLFSCHDVVYAFVVSQDVCVVLFVFHVLPPELVVVCVFQVVVVGDVVIQLVDVLCDDDELVELEVELEVEVEVPDGTSYAINVMLYILISDPDW